MRNGAAKQTSLRVMALAIAVGEAAPSEFRIFAAGKNVTSKGTYLFDQQAARDVMAAYESHGIDAMIDLEHLSLEDTEDSRNFDPDARGWCKLEVRNGELWAVDVTWTPDGLARLSERRQRYISPAFGFDPKTGRISELLNIAITALPATHNLEPLVAASARARLVNDIGQGASPMTPEQFSQIAEALGLGADANVEDVLATVAAMVKKIQDAANGDEPGKDVPKEMPLAENAPAPMVAAARLQTAARALARLSGKADIGEAIREVEAWRTSHVELESNRAKLSEERAALEGGERRRLVGELVKLGAEIPATAWADDSATKPAEPWASMPIAQLRDRVVKLSGAKGGTLQRRVQIPSLADEDGGQVVKVNGESVQLSAREVEACKESGAKPEDYAANKLIRTRARGAHSA
jgi:phage I-like protein